MAKRSSKPKERRPYRSGGYWKAPNGHYKARFHLPDGRTLWRWWGTEDEARKWLNEQIELVRVRQLPPLDRGETLAIFVERWLGEIALEQVRGKSTPPGPVTMEGYRRMAQNYLVRPLGSLKMSELRRGHIDALLKWLRVGQTMPDGLALGVRSGVQLSRKPLKAQTLRHFHHFLKALFEEAELEKLVVENPMLGRKPPGIPDYEHFQGKALDLPTLLRVLSIAETKPNGAAITAVALLGCRRGELLGLTWSNVHLDAEVPWLVLERSMQRVVGQGLQPLRVKTEKSLRAVAISRRLADALRRHRESPETGQDCVFASPRLRDHAMSPEYLWNRVWSPIRDQANLGSFRLHDFRHTLQTNSHLKAQIPEAVSLAYFGWTKSETAMSYTHITRAVETLPMATALDEMLDQAASEAGGRR